MSGWWPSKVSVKGLSYRLTFLIRFPKKLVKLVKFVIVTHQSEDHKRVFGFLLIEICSRKAVPEVPSTFNVPLHYTVTVLRP